MTAVRVPRPSVPGGYAPLDSGLLIPAAYLPVGTTAATGTLQLDGTAANLALASGTSPAAGATGKAADAGHSHPRLGFAPADHGLLGWTHDPTLCLGSYVLGIAGRLYLAKLHVPVAASVTNLVLLVGAGGSNLTAGECFAGLWDAASGALLGVTADQSSAWASSGNRTAAIVGGPIAVGVGDVYVGVWFNGTTGPALYRGGANPCSNVGLTYLYRCGYVSGDLTTTPPATLAAVSPMSPAIWAAIS